MNTRRKVVRKVEKDIVNAGATLQVIEMHLKCKLLQMINFRLISGYDGWWSKGSTVKMAQGITTQAQAITTQANREVVFRDNQHSSTMASRLRYFTRTNPPMNFGSKVRDDPQDFLDEVYKILFAMGVIIVEKDELAAYKVKDVAQAWYNHWKDNQALGDGPVTWEILQKAFLDRFFTI